MKSPSLSASSLILVASSLRAAKSFITISLTSSTVTFLDSNSLTVALATYSFNDANGNPPLILIASATSSYHSKNLSYNPSVKICVW